MGQIWPLEDVNISFFLFAVSRVYSTPGIHSGGALAIVRPGICVHSLVLLLFQHLQGLSQRPCLLASSIPASLHRSLCVRNLLI